MDELNKNERFLLMTNNYNQYAQSDGLLTFPAQGSARNKEPRNAINETFSEKGPANIKGGFFDDEPTSPLNTNLKVEEIKEVDEVEEETFDPSKLNLKYANKGQLLGYILHFDKTQTGNVSIDMSKGQLQTIAGKIKKSLLLKAEADEARLQAEIEIKAKARLAAQEKADIAEAKAQAKI